MKITSNQVKRKFTSLLIIALMILTASPFSMAQSSGFSDVSGSHWANEAIQSMASQGLLKGTGNGRFNPDGALTREQFAALLTNTFNLDIPNTGTQTFSDVGQSTWSYGYIEAARPYLTGFFPPNGKAFFNPTENATREDIAVALAQVMKMDYTSLDEKSVLNKFDDYSDISPELRQEVAAVVNTNLMVGDNNGDFNPQEPLTRAAAASVLYKVLKSSVAEATKEIVLSIDIPETVNSANVKLTGKTVKDAKVTINDDVVDNNNGKFTYQTTLDKGEGKYSFEIKATLQNGQSRTLTKTVSYTSGTPILTMSTSLMSSKPSITITGKVSDPSGSTPSVTVNDEDAYVYNGTFTKDVTLNVGENKFKIIATNSVGKTTVLEKIITFNAGGPVLKIGEMPETTDKNYIYISATATDLNDRSPKIYVNGSSIDSGSIYSSFNLKEGSNTFVIKAVNSLGKSTTETRTVTFSVGGPVLKIGEIPETTDKNYIYISASATDVNDRSPKIYVNGSSIDSGSIYSRFSLKEGVNTFVIKAVNSLGKAATETRMITFSVGGPVLKIGEIPETTGKDYVYISASATDTNDSSPRIYVNGSAVDSGSIYSSFSLKEGLNTFVIKAVNSLGKSATETRMVTRVTPSPEISITSSANSPTASYTLVGNVVSGDGTSNPETTVNGKVSGSWGGSFSCNITLAEGQNTIIVKSTNSSGKSTSKNFVVTYSIPDPVLQCSIPTTLNKGDQISGIAYAPSGGGNIISVTINGQAVQITSSGNWNYTVKADAGVFNISIKVTASTGKTAEQTFNTTVTDPNAVVQPIIPQS